MVKKISIITPSYNQGKYIEDAILSVINQKYSNFEHIIVDGKSSDETLDILKKYEHLTWISEKDKISKDDVSAACNDYLKVFGYLSLAHSWLKILKVSYEKLDKNNE